MATRTSIMSSGEGGNVTVEVDYDDVTNRALVLRQKNLTALPADPRAIYAKVTYIDPATGRKDESKTFPTAAMVGQNPNVTPGGFWRTPAGRTDATPIPAAVADQIPLVIVPLRGRQVVSNLNVETHFPEM